MTDEKQPLSKTCANCGLQKPLSAFLQLSETKGTSYGNICAHCRKTQVDNKNPTEPEESTRSTTGHKIDHKAKVAGDLDKLQSRTKIDEEYYEERAETEVEKNLVDAKHDKIKAEEKKHRSTYLEKHPFLSTNKKNSERGFSLDKKTEQTNQKFAEISANAQQEKSQKDEKVKREIDLTAPFVPSQTGEIKYQSAVFNQFKAWLGASAPIVKHAEKIIQNKGAENPTEPSKDPSPSDYIKNTWGPNSRGRK